MVKMADHEDAVREWSIPIPDECDKYSGIKAERRGDDYFMKFIGTRAELTAMARAMLRKAGEL